MKPGIPLYLVGRDNVNRTSELDHTWEFMGIFDTPEMADGACTTEHDWVAPVVLNRRAPDESKPFENTIYPRRTIA